jgi:hypothetical protein
LALERQLGRLLPETVKPGNPIVIGDDNCQLPKDVTRNASSAAQALAETVKHGGERWKVDVVRDDNKIPEGMSRDVSSAAQAARLTLERQLGNLYAHAQKAY